MVSCCEHGRELPSSIKVGELLDKIGSMELYVYLRLYLFI